MKRGLDKRGLSPIVATVLLISIAIILALIIFFWAKSFLSEKVQKFDGPIDQSCQNIQFVAEIDSTNSQISVENKGNVPIAGLRLKSADSDSVETISSFKSTIKTGQTTTLAFPEDAIGKITAGNKIMLAPIILGEQGDVKKEYLCSDDFGVEVEAI